MCLGDNEFHRYFMDTNDVSDMHFTSLVEILHYLDIIIPNQLSDCNFSELFASKTNAKMSL